MNDELIREIMIGQKPLKNTNELLLKKEIIRLNEEIERLNNKVKEQSLLLIEFQDMEQRLKEKESIIKEAREYIKAVGVLPKQIDSFVIFEILKGE